MSVRAISMVMNFPTDKVAITGIWLGNDPGKPLSYNIMGDELRIGWNSLNPIVLQTGECLLTIKVRITGTLTTDETVRFTLAPDPLNELADADINVIPDAVLNIDLIHGSAIGTNDITGQDIIRFTSYPNPFYNTTTLAYSLPADGSVTIEVRNMIGIVVKTVLENKQEIAGEHKMIMDASVVAAGRGHLELGAASAGCLHSYPEI